MSIYFWKMMRALEPLQTVQPGPLFHHYPFRHKCLANGQFFDGRGAFLLDKKANKMVKWEIRSRSEKVVCGTVFENRSCVERHLVFGSLALGQKLKL